MTDASGNGGDGGGVELARYKHQGALFRLVARPVNRLGSLYKQRKRTTEGWEDVERLGWVPGRRETREDGPDDGPAPGPGSGRDLVGVWVCGGCGERLPDSMGGGCPCGEQPERREFVSVESVLGFATDLREAGERAEKKAEAGPGTAGGAESESEGGGHNQYDHRAIRGLAFQEAADWLETAVNGVRSASGTERGGETAEPPASGQPVCTCGPRDGCEECGGRCPVVRADGLCGNERPCPEHDSGGGGGGEDGQSLLAEIREGDSESANGGYHVGTERRGEAEQLVDEGEVVRMHNPAGRSPLYVPMGSDHYTDNRLETLRERQAGGQDGTEDSGGGDSTDSNNGDGGDNPPPGTFDYNERREDGQFENHPTTDEGEFVQEVRTTYVHGACGSETSMSRGLAESVARDPTYYSKTFCADCGGYFPVEQFEWVDGEPWVRNAGGAGGARR